VEPTRAPSAACALCRSGGARLRFRVAGYPLWRCPRCRHEWLEPQPDERALAELYTEDYYDSWGLERRQAHVRELKLRTFSARLELAAPWLERGARVLDVGCATGFFLEAARLSGYSPFGVELSAFGAAVARERFGRGRVHHGPLEGAAFTDNAEGRFEAVFLSDVLEHVREPRRTLALVRSLLVPGGAVVITAPDAGSASHRLLGRAWPHYKLEHLHHFTRANLVGLLEQAGFRDASVRRAPKRMSLAYVCGQYARYRHPVLSPLLRAVELALPERWLERGFWVTFGEMSAVARR
jgi:SAM-dependent methyltransferase